MPVQAGGLVVICLASINSEIKLIAITSTRRAKPRALTFNEISKDTDQRAGRHSSIETAGEARRGHDGSSCYMCLLF